MIVNYCERFVNLNLWGLNMNHSNKGTQRWPLPKSAGRLQYGLDHRLHAVSKKHRSRRASYTTLKGVSVARPTPYTHQLGTLCRTGDFVIGRAPARAST